LRAVSHLRLPIHDFGSANGLRNPSSRSSEFDLTETASRNRASSGRVRDWPCVPPVSAFWRFSRERGAVETSGDQPVISAGPYRVIRHPSYSGVVLAFIGLGFILGNWISLIPMTVMGTGGLVYRIRVDEWALTRDFGGKYRADAAGRKRLVPNVW
jgi:hypothetical protein